MSNLILIVASILSFLSSRLLTLTLISPPPPYNPPTCLLVHWRCCQYQEPNSLLVASLTFVCISEY